MKLKGDVVGQKHDKELLESLGVKIISIKGASVLTKDGTLTSVTFNCEVDEQAMERLDKYWGRFIWYLE